MVPKTELKKTKVVTV